MNALLHILQCYCSRRLAPTMFHILLVIFTMSKQHGANESMLIMNNKAVVCVVMRRVMENNESNCRGHEETTPFPLVSYPDAHALNLW